MLIKIHIESPNIVVKKDRDDESNCMVMKLEDIWVENIIEIKQPRLMNST